MAAASLPPSRIPFSVALTNLVQPALKAFQARIETVLFGFPVKHVFKSGTISPNGFSKQATPSESKTIGENMKGL